MGVIKKVNETIKLGAKNFAIPAINSLVATRPEFIPYWVLVQGLFLSALDIQKEKTIEFAKFIKNNSGKFTKKIVNSNEFKDGFVYTFEQYLKQRNFKKRLLIQKIFLGYATSKDKQSFEFERMYDVINKLSVSQIEILKEKFSKGKRITFWGNQKGAEEYHHGDLKYMEYLGLLILDRKVEIDNSSSSVGGDDLDDLDVDINSEYNEYETFTLSAFGGDFIKFIEAK